MTTVRERVRKFRERQKTGAAVVCIVVADEVATVEMLVSAGLLDPYRVDDPAAVALAVGRLVDTLCKESNP